MADRCILGHLRFNVSNSNIKLFSFLTCITASGGTDVLLRFDRLQLNGKKAWLRVTRVDNASKLTGQLVFISNIFHILTNSQGDLAPPVNIDLLGTSKRKENCQPNVTIGYVQRTRAARAARAGWDGAQAAQAVCAAVCSAGEEECAHQVRNAAVANAGKHQCTVSTVDQAVKYSNSQFTGAGATPDPPATPVNSIPLCTDNIYLKVRCLGVASSLGASRGGWVAPSPATAQTSILPLPSRLKRDALLLVIGDALKRRHL
eukprot:516805-Pelagomonas_calceolata.AAC.3